MSTESKEGYGIGKLNAGSFIPAPNLNYRPARPRAYNPAIGLIGCGGITQHHLKAYQNAGFRVVAFCDIDKARATKSRDTFFPEAAVYDDYRDVLRRDDIEVVDVATHPHQRMEILDAALDARKHVLSQKPFVLDLDVGERLVAKAGRQGVRLAVNQNGRWAPHFAWMNAAIQQGLIGEITGISFTLNWDHSWIAGTEFEKVHHIILYDFAIHWFDIASKFLSTREATQVTAAAIRASGQTVKPPLVASALVEYEGAVVDFMFNGASAFGASDRTLIIGTKGTLESSGVDLNKQTVKLSRVEGISQPELQGAWFPEGFQGTMAELLCSVEENREPSNSAGNNLRSLALAFAAMQSADQGKPAVPGLIRSIT